ncbi:hypothetical protein [Streptomyces sp. NPDC048665]|uniref:hypothetical protein n=1 Tax=Streptomyces sp. NPDC048665 TaxID=3155490 RepID=UPI00341B1262
MAATPDPVPAKDISVKLGRGTAPGQVEPVRDKLRRLADRGWLHRTPAGPLHRPAAASRMTALSRMST